MCFRVKILMPENRVYESDLGNCSNTSKYKKRFDSKSYAFGCGQSRRGRDRALGKLLIGVRTGRAEREEFERWPCGYLI